MKTFHALLLLLAGALLVPSAAIGQILSVPDQKEFADSIREELELGPYFGLYKDCYFTVGSTQTGHPDKMNSDVKFQISLGIRLTPPHAAREFIPFHHLFAEDGMECVSGIDAHARPQLQPRHRMGKAFFQQGALPGESVADD